MKQPPPSSPKQNEQLPKLLTDGIRQHAAALRNQNIDVNVKDDHVRRTHQTSQLYFSIISEMERYATFMRWFEKYLRTIPES